MNKVYPYNLKGSNDGYFSNEVEIDTCVYDRNKSLFIDLQMCIDSSGKAKRLQNFNLDLAQWNILPTSRSELDYLAKLMQDNPTIKVEISTHTDSRGGNDFNFDLPQKRVQSTVYYLELYRISKDR